MYFTTLQVTTFFPSTKQNKTFFWSQTLSVYSYFDEMNCANIFFDAQYLIKEAIIHEICSNNDICNDFDDSHNATAKIKC